MGLAFLGDLARQRSLASAALLFLVLVDEIEGLVFVAVGVLARRQDLFLSAQDSIFPAIVCVAGAVSLARNWRRRRPQVEEAPMEMLDAAMLAMRIGELQPAIALEANPHGAAISLYGLSRERTSRQG